MARQTVLHTAALDQGGRMVDFHGWTMAVQFAGITQEHRAVRTSCGLFDLCHMGRLRLQGPGAEAFLAKRICRPLAGMRPGQVRYGLVLAEDGTVEDDILVSLEHQGSYHIVVNAANTGKILAMWGDAAVQGVQLTDHTADEAMIAVQGPAAVGLLAGIGLDGQTLRNYHVADLVWKGVPVRLSRTGYTGEDGFECFVTPGSAVGLWQALVAAGATPCGLGCRDTLRLEAGMPLYGHELDRAHTPVEAGLGFAIGRGGGYIGAERVLDQLEHGPQVRLVGLTVTDRRVPRSHYPVLHEGRPVGSITSGTLSPTLGSAIGMAYVPTGLAQTGQQLAVDIRGTACPATVVPLPFYRRPSVASA